MKKRLMLFIIGSLLLKASIVYAETNYFNNKELIDISNLNNTQMQNIVQSTAEQYLNKYTLTDYEQKAMDVGDDKKTFNFRNFNMTPFDLSRSNPNNFDCSSFVTNVYMNAFGFSFIDYYTLSTIPTTTNYVNNNKITPLLDKNIFNLSSSEKEKRLSQEYNNLKNALLFSGKGISTGILETVAKKTTVDNYGLIPFIWNNADNKKDISANAINKMINNMYSTLETGDILLIRKISSDGNTKSGHVLLYVKEHYIPSKEEWAEGFIHSQGKDYPMDIYNFINTTEYGEDEYSVRFIRKKCYIEDCEPNDGKTTGLNFTDKSKTRVYFIAIIRPINVIKNGNYRNIYNYTYNENNDKSIKTTQNIYNLAEYFKDKNNLSMQQYLYNKTEGKRIYNTNVIKSGEEIYVKYYFYNKSNKKLTFNIQYSPTNNGNKNLYTNSNPDITNKKNYFYYSSKDKDNNYATVKRTFENNIVTMKITLSPKQSINAYYKLYYKNESDTTEELAFNGLKVYLSDTIDSKKIITFNKMYATAAGNKYKTAVKSEYSKIYNHYYNNKQKKKETAKDSIYELFNLDNNPQNIINMLFSVCDKNYYYGVECNNQNSTSSTSEKNKIKSMVVKGMYGGQRVRGNTDNNRIRRLSFDYLEAGDVIVACRHNSYCKTVVYNGKKEVKNVKTNEIRTEDISFTQLYDLNEGTNTIYHLEKTSKSSLMNILTYDAFVVLRPLKEVHYSSPLLSQIENKNPQKYIATFLSNERDITVDEGLEEDIIISDIEDNINDNEEDEIELSEENAIEEENEKNEEYEDEVGIYEEESNIEQEKYINEQETKKSIREDKNITINPPTGLLKYLIISLLAGISLFLTIKYVNKTE